MAPSLHPDESMFPMQAPPVRPVSRYNVPQDATTTLFVVGVPLDATEREVGHIFRQHEGFRSLRLLKRESKKFQGTQHIICFVEFEDRAQAAASLNFVQGYVFDEKHPETRLSVNYATSSLRNPRSHHHGGSHSNAGGLSIDDNDGSDRRRFRDDRDSVAKELTASAVPYSSETEGGGGTSGNSAELSTSDFPSLEEDDNNNSTSTTNTTNNDEDDDSRRKRYRR